MPKFRTHYNAERVAKGYAKNLSPTLTIQDEDTSLEQLMKRYKAGMDLEDNDSKYFDEEDINKINKYYNPGALDLTDLQELKERNMEMQKIYEDALSKKQKDEAEKAEKERIMAEAKKLWKTQKSDKTEENTEE